MMQKEVFPNLFMRTGETWRINDVKGTWMKKQRNKKGTLTD
jgi:hypothetical protein